jgi:hypothetical protein
MDELNFAPDLVLTRLDELPAAFQTNEADVHDLEHVVRVGPEADISCAYHSGEVGDA